MKAPITSGFVTWPTIRELPPLVIEEGHDGLERTAMPMPDDTGTGWVELIPLAVGMSIARGGNSFTEKARGLLIPYQHIKASLAEPAFVISAVQKGRVILREYDLNTDLQCGKGFVVFRHLEQIDYEIILDASSDVDGINLFIGRTSLAMLLGESLAGELLVKLNIAQAPSATVQLVPPQITAILFSAVQEHLTGQMRRLHAQAKSLEFLSALAHHLVHDKQPYATASGHKEQLVEQLHNELTHLEGKVPSLEVLAQQYGISARLLNDEFRKRYGSSIYNYVSELRLTAAHEKLIKTAMPMKILALNMGYSHVNHFISAFGKKFGYSPGSLRKKGNDF